MELKDICQYVTKKVTTNTLTTDNYISTENMLPDKGGVVVASGLPTGNAIAFATGDVLISNIRPYFKKIWQADKEGGCSADVLCFRTNECVDNKYFYYLLSQQSFFDYMMSGSKGCKMPRGDKKQIMQWLFDLPSLEEQKRIAGILSSLDDKIELNRRINENLETMAKQLYDYWFVQFDFPNEEGKPYKSSGGEMVWNEKLKREIPKGWQAVPLSYWLEIKSGFPFNSETYQTVGNYKIITIKNVQDGNLITTGCDYVNDIPMQAKDYIALQIGDRLISLTGNCGRLCVVTENNLLLNQRVGLLECDCDDLLEYTYNLLNSTYMRSIIENLANGAAQANLSPIDLCKTISILPPKETLCSYNCFAFPLRNKMIQCKQEIHNLTKQRDELLPLLMNGQVSVNSD